MKNVFATNSLWGVIAASSVLSKVILIGGSIVLIACLFVFIYKMLVLREKIRQVVAVCASLQQSQSVNDIVALSSTLNGTLPGAILSRGLKTLKQLLQHGETTKAKLTARDVSLIEESMDHVVEEVMHDEQAYINILSVSAAAAPLVGLFGTVSGLIQAFIAIGQQHTTDITAIAPGIAEALVTTFAGLVVAIPALIMFHYVMSMIREFEHHLCALVHSFEWTVKHLLAD